MQEDNQTRGTMRPNLGDGHAAYDDGDFMLVVIPRSGLWFLEPTKEAQLYARMEREGSAWTFRIPDIGSRDLADWWCRKLAPNVEMLLDSVSFDHEGRVVHGSLFKACMKRISLSILSVITAEHNAARYRENGMSVMSPRQFLEYLEGSQHIDDVMGEASRATGAMTPTNAAVYRALGIAWDLKIAVVPFAGEDGLDEVMAEAVERHLGISNDNQHPLPCP